MSKYLYALAPSKSNFPMHKNTSYQNYAKKLNIKLYN